MAAGNEKKNIGYYVKLIRAKDKSSEVHERLEGIDKVEGYIVKDSQINKILFIFRSNDKFDVALGFVGRGWRSVEKKKVEVSEDLIRSARFFLNDIEALKLHWTPKKK